MFVITNDKVFIMQRTHGISTTQNVEEAIHYPDSQRADNFFRNLPKSYRNIGFAVKEYEPRKELQHNWAIEDYLNEKCMDDVRNKIMDVQTFIRNIYAQKEFAEKQLEHSEKELMDIEHAAEFYNLNAAQGYKLYKMLHETRTTRRKYKDQLMIIDYIMEGGIEDIVNGTVLKRIDGMDNRQYKPRVLEELFEAERNHN